MGRFLIFCLCFFPLVGCGSIPQPYQGDAPRELTLPFMDKILLVYPVDESASAMIIAKSMALVLGEIGIPAVVQFIDQKLDSPLDDVLIYDLKDNPDGGLQVDWTLMNSEGKVLKRYSQILPPIPQKSTSRSLRRWFQKPAVALTQQMIQTDHRAVATLDKGISSNNTPILVYFQPLMGLSSDGNQLLGQALTDGLKRAGLQLQDQEENSLYKITGHIAVVAGSLDQDLVMVVWRLTREPQGVELATISQNGNVVRGQLDRTWAGIAPAIAEAGIGGLLQIIRADQGQ